MRARHLSGLYTPDELGLQPHRRAGRVGVDAAALWIGPADGGNGLENFLRVNFPRDPVGIRDSWHAAEYLADPAKALHPGDEAQGAAAAAALADDVHHCPHGRPTSLLFSKHDLDRQFWRV